MIGLENGSIYYSKDDALLPFSASGAVTKIYYNTTSLNLIVGDASGGILVAQGQTTFNFSYSFSYREHSCRIVSIIAVEDWIITSDDCGYIVQYNMVDQLLLDKTTHPGRTGNQKIMLTHWMDGDFGVSVVENQSSVYLYRISDSKTGDYLDLKLVTLVGTIAGIPTLRIMIKASMPLLVWL